LVDRGQRVHHRHRYHLDVRHERGSLAAPVAPRSAAGELLATAGVLALLSIEATLISRWARMKLSSKPANLGVYTCATLFAWLLTFLALWDVVP
jgi:hypothetical protein